MCLFSPFFFFFLVPRVYFLKIKNIKKNWRSKVFFMQLYIFL
jgi:hypothetical protein